MTAAGAEVRRRPRGSIRTQLIIRTVIGLALVLALFGFFVRYVVVTTLMETVDHDLLERIEQTIHRAPPPRRPFDSNGQAFDGGQQPGRPPDFQQQPQNNGNPNVPQQFFPGPQPQDDLNQDQGQSFNGPTHDGQGPPPQYFDSNGQPPQQQPRFPGQPPNDQPFDHPNSPQPGGDGFQNQFRPDQVNGGRNLPGGVYRPRRFRLDGTSLDMYNSSPAWDAAAIKTAGMTEKPVFTTVKSGTVELRVLTERVQPRGRREWFAQAPYPLTQVNSAIEGVDRALLTLIPIALLIAGVGGAFVTENVLTRVRQLVQSATKIGAENLSERLPVVGSDEFAELAETFNALLQRVDIAFQEQARIVEQQRRFTADASHELKTPLTVIRGTTSLALTESGSLDRSATTEIDSAAALMSDLVQDLIYLARADAGQLGRERIDLLVIEPLQAAVDRIAAISPTPIRLTAAGDLLVVNGSESELIRLFSNILQNASNHTPQDGLVTVILTGTKHDAIITAADTGVGIATEHLDHLTERFYRVDAARSREMGGSGLGLAICKGIVDAHGGTLTIQSIVGKGTTVTVTLPRVSNVSS